VSGRRTAARVLTVLSSLALAAGAATAVARELPVVPGLAPDTWVMLTSFTDAGVLACLAAVAGSAAALLLRRSWLPAVTGLVALALTAVHVGWLLPAWVPDDRPVAGPARVRVLALNLRLGDADPVAVVRAAADADVLVLTEITQPAQAGLEAAGVSRVFGYQAGGTLPQSGASGTRIYSRYPFDESHQLVERQGQDHWLVELQVPGMDPLQLAAVHPSRPRPGGDVWAGCGPRCRPPGPSSPGTSTPSTATPTCGGCARTASPTATTWWARAGTPPTPRRAGSRR
jgi:hypothetical protein